MNCFEINCLEINSAFNAKKGAVEISVEPEEIDASGIKMDNTEPQSFLKSVFPQTELLQTGVEVNISLKFAKPCSLNQ